MFELLGRKRPAELVGGADLADRCSDAILFYCLRTVPLSAGVRATISTKLEGRWGSLALGAAGAGLGASLAAFFEGRRLSDKAAPAAPAGPGCAVVQQVDP